MTYGVIHYNAPGATLEEFLAWASGAGFESVELQIGDIWPDETKDPVPTTEVARDLARKYGIKVSAIASGNDFVVLEEDAIAAQVARMKTICEITTMLDCYTIRTEGGSPKDSVPEDRWVEAIAGCCKASLGFLKEMGVRYAIDNHGWVTNKIDVIMGVLQAVDEPEWIGSNLDTMNVRWFGNTLEDIDDFYRQVAPWVMHTHMKDGEGARENYRGRDLGNGEINLALAVECVKAAGYDGAWTAEYEGRESTDIGYEKCLVWMKHKI
jgi:sugar phosphate isomerase/epimerase